MHVYHDSLQEGSWFRDLNPNLTDSELRPFPRIDPDALTPLTKVISYDRPDIVLTDDEDNPLLVLERTVEVPSGHNVGQRFARLAQAARCKVPAVYFGPYSAVKHGGITSGPRYMNLRLFHAIDKVEKIEQSPITTIRWPVDGDFEIIRGPKKDVRVIEYLQLFFASLDTHHNIPEVSRSILNSEFEVQQHLERMKFIDDEVTNPEQYDGPPPSVRFEKISQYPGLVGIGLAESAVVLVIYDVGMRAIRSDPYTGMAILYAYLYCGGMVNRSQPLVLHFPHVTKEDWATAAITGRRKDIRLFKEAADAIIFADGALLSDQL